MKVAKTQGNFRNAPHMYTCPLNLMSQVTDEWYRYVDRKAFDVFPYVGQPRTRPEFWHSPDFFNKSKLPMIRRVVIASHLVSISVLNREKLIKYFWALWGRL